MIWTFLQPIYLWTAKNLHYLYLMIALPIVLITARITPPFQVPDEPHHFCRAEQVSRLRWVAVFHPDGPRPLAADTLVLLPDPGGFITDAGIDKVDSVYAYLEFRPREKVRADKVAQARDIHWNSGTIYGEFTNTALYPPFGYLPAALGIVIGRMFDLSVVNTLYLSRWLSGLCCVLICFFAMRLTRAAAPLLFLVLLFPMTIALFASVSQDGILIALASLFAALIYDAEKTKQYSPRRKLLMILCMAAICAAKPPYFPLTLVFFFLSISKKERIISFSATFALILLWVIVNHRNYGIIWAPPDRRINASLQLHHIFAHPFHFAGLFFKLNWSGIRDHIWMFIGLLGWEDLSFPMWFYRSALFMGVVAMLLTMRVDLRDIRLKVAMGVIILLAIAGIMTGQYVTWMPLDSPMLGGVQSRYFIPLTPFLMLALGVGGGRDLARSPASMAKGRIFGMSAVYMFAIFMQIVLIAQLIGRYYE